MVLLILAALVAAMLIGGAGMRRLGRASRRGLNVFARERADRVPPAQGMSLQEARSVLGVGPDAGGAEIEAAYRRLMRRVHPDHGGAAGLAAQLNAARAALTKRG